MASMFSQALVQCHYHLSMKSSQKPQLVDEEVVQELAQDWEEHLVSVQADPVTLSTLQCDHRTRCQPSRME